MMHGPVNIRFTVEMFPQFYILFL